MLQAIQALPHSEAEEVLARAIDAFLPNPHEVLIGDLEHRVIQEARQVAGPNDDAVITRLGDELAALLLPPEREQATRDRLGHQGDLPLNLFDVSFSRYWLEAAASNDGYYGIDEDEALATFQGDAVVAHGDALAAYDPRQSRYQSSAIVAAAAHAPTPHWVLYTLSKRGSKLEIDATWRLFPDEVRLPPRASPVVMMTKFCERYGLEMRFSGHKQKIRFAWALRLETKTFSVEVPKNTPMRNVVLWKEVVGAEGFVTAIDIYQAWCIDVRRYVASMQKHGIAVQVR